MKTFLITFTLVILAIIGWKNFSQTPVWKYSEGERAGVLRKISSKGIIHKTYEAELMLNANMGTVNLEAFRCSVQSDSIAHILLTNAGKSMTLSYNQYVLMPSKVASTKYLITGVKLD